MVSKSSKDRSGGPAGKSSPTRAEQQAQALRDNLRRRKGQSRARQDGGGGPAGGENASDRAADPPKD